MFRIDDELKEFVESGVAVVLGTASAERRPLVFYGWGPRVMESRHALQVFLERARAEHTLANLGETGLIAVTVAHPVAYRSIQFKGHHISTTAATDADKAWIERHRNAFASSTALIGDSPGIRRNAWMASEEMLRFEVEVDSAFDQTPGPNAGEPL